MTLQITNGNYTIDTEYKYILKCPFFKNLYDVNNKLDDCTQIELSETFMDIFKRFIETDVVDKDVDNELLAEYINYANFLGYDDLIGKLMPQFMTEEYKIFIESSNETNKNFIELMTYKEFNFIINMTDEEISSTFKNFDISAPNKYLINNYTRAKILVDQMVKSIDVRSWHQPHSNECYQAFMINYINNIILVNNQDIDDEINYLIGLPSNILHIIILYIRCKSNTRFGLLFEKIFDKDHTVFEKYLTGDNKNPLYAVESVIAFNSDELVNKIYDVYKDSPLKWNDNKNILNYICDWNEQHDYTKFVLRIINDHPELCNKMPFLHNHPLYYACKNGRNELALKIIENGIEGDINKFDHDYCARRHIMFYIVHRAMDDVGEKIIDLIDLNDIDRDRNNPVIAGSVFLWACATKMTKIVNKMLDKNYNVYYANENGDDCILFACYNKMKDIVDKMIKNNYNCNSISKNGSTALQCAITYGWTDIAQKIIDKSINTTGFKTYINSYYDSHVIFNIIKNNMDDICVTIIEFVDFDKIGEAKNSIFQLACKYKMIKTVTKMLDKNIYVIDHVDDNGDDSIIFACLNGWIKIVDKLIDLKFNCDRKTKNGTTMRFIVQLENVIRGNNAWDDIASKLNLH